MKQILVFCSNYFSCDVILYAYSVMLNQRKLWSLDLFKHKGDSWQRACAGGFCLQTGMVLSG